MNGPAKLTARLQNVIDMYEYDVPATALLYPWEIPPEPIVCAGKVASRVYSRPQQCWIAFVARLPIANNVWV